MPKKTNREIRFRAWNKESRVMTGIVSLFFNNHSGSVHLVNPLYRGKCFRMDECELMQFTGLKDKNGREIYEGDLVQETFSVGKEIKGRIQEVFWDEEHASFAIKPASPYISCGIAYSKEREIIGNIYENPELLGDKQCPKRQTRSSVS